MAFKSTNPVSSVYYHYDIEYGGTASVKVKHNCELHGRYECNFDKTERTISTSEDCTWRTSEDAKSKLLDRLKSMTDRFEGFTSVPICNIVSCEKNK